MRDDIHLPHELCVCLRAEVAVDGGLDGIEGLDGVFEEVWCWC